MDCELLLGLEDAVELLLMLELSLPQELLLPNDPLPLDGEPLPELDVESELLLLCELSLLCD